MRWRDDQARSSSPERLLSLEAGPPQQRTCRVGARHRSRVAPCCPLGNHADWGARQKRTVAKTCASISPMASRTVVTLISDLSGEPGAVTVSFAVENTNWQIDLTRAERDDFVRALATYTENGRRVTGGSSPSGTSTR